MKKHTFIYFSIVIIFSSCAMAGTLTTLNVPGATGTQAMSIDGGKVAGFYADSSSRLHGFIYDGTSWTIINKPGADSTYVTGIDGSNVVGYYHVSQGGTYNFIYDGTTWTSINSSVGMDSWIPTGISGDNIIGYYQMGAVHHGVIYNTKTATLSDINYQAGWTEARGIDGDNIVGINMITNDYGIHTYYHGFLDNGSTWTLLDVPGSSQTEAYTIDGSNIVGMYKAGTNYYNFLYNGSTWKTLDDLSAISKRPNDIEGDKIVGYYSDGTGSHGFVYTIPEPCTLMLFGFGVTLIIKRK